MEPDEYEHVGQLVFVQQGNDYVARMEPVIFKSEFQVMEIARINMRLCRDETDFLRWRDDVVARWKDSIARCFEADPDCFGITMVDTREKKN